jgi:hypothetical protein
MLVTGLEIRKYQELGNSIRDIVSQKQKKGIYSWTKRMIRLSGCQKPPPIAVFPLGLFEHGFKPFHAWRCYFVAKYIRAGISPLAVMLCTGHDTLAMVMYYASISRKQAFEEFDRLPKHGTNSGQSLSLLRATA